MKESNSSSRTPHRPKLIAIVGPTASGKTSLGVMLSKKFGGEIVSADSRQIYKGMSIGTAKPPFRKIAKKLSSDGIPHYLVDVREPDENYTVADFKKDAIATIQNIIHRGKIPFLVGGTGLYIKAILENLDIPKVKENPALRRKIEREIATVGLAAVFKKLVARDPEAAYIVDPQNPRRVVRALEVTLMTGKPFSATRKKQPPLFETLTIGVTRPDAILRKRINGRIDAMMRDGLVREVKSLIKKYGHGQTPFDAIGYREIIDALNGKYPLAEAVALMKSNTWHYAKRQMTWFKKDKTTVWIKHNTEAGRLVRQFLK
jgi:tRNA dimethylallyltransferase